MFLNYFLLISINLFLIYNCHPLKRKKRVAVAYEKQLWPNKTIYYSISRDFEDEMVDLIKGGIHQWKSHTCLQFIDCRSFCNLLGHYAYFKPANECSSTVGFDFSLKEQIVNLDAIGCDGRTYILHEIGHLIGLHHEHQRPDRDKFIKLIEKNIDKDNLDHFEKLNHDDVYVSNKYDYNSIMHYSTDDYSKNGEPTFEILKKHENIEKIGKFEYLSKSNIEEVNELYDCEFTRSKFKLHTNSSIEYTTSITFWVFLIWLFNQSITIYFDI